MGAARPALRCWRRRPLRLASAAWRTRRGGCGWLRRRRPPDAGRLVPSAVLGGHGRAWSLPRDLHARLAPSRKIGWRSARWPAAPRTNLSRRAAAPTRSTPSACNLSIMAREPPRSPSEMVFWRWSSFARADGLRPPGSKPRWNRWFICATRPPRPPCPPWRAQRLATLLLHPLPKPSSGRPSGRAREMAVELDRVKVPEVHPEIRVKSYDEAVLGYTRKLAVAEALRCIDCKTKPCTYACPALTRAPEYIQ